MKKLLNSMALSIFSSYTKRKGFRFSIANTIAEKNDSEKLINDWGYKLPEILKKEMEIYKTNTIKFVAYHNNKPVGTVCLADPKIANRPYQLHGIDRDGLHFEIQNLVISKEYRESSQLVFLGLFKEMYLYSLQNSITSWISFGLMQLYMTVQRYNKCIWLAHIGESNYSKPLANYLYTNNIFDVCFIMNVDDFEPWTIFKKFIKREVKKRRTAQSLRKADKLLTVAGSDIPQTNIPAPALEMS